jgi:hypothetical protein
VALVLTACSSSSEDSSGSAAGSGSQATTSTTTAPDSYVLVAERQYGGGFASKFDGFNLTRFRLSDGQQVGSRSLAENSSCHPETQGPKLTALGPGGMARAMLSPTGEWGSWVTRRSDAGSGCNTSWIATDVDWGRYCTKDQVALDRAAGYLDPGHIVSLSEADRAVVETDVGNCQRTTRGQVDFAKVPKNLGLNLSAVLAANPSRSHALLGTSILNLATGEIAPLQARKDDPKDFLSGQVVKDFLWSPDGRTVLGIIGAVGSGTGQSDTGWLPGTPPALAWRSRTAPGWVRLTLNSGQPRGCWPGRTGPVAAPSS